MKTNKLLLFIVAVATIVACQKENEVQPGTEIGSSSALQERTIPLHDNSMVATLRPKSIEKDGEVTTFNYSSDGLLTGYSSPDQAMEILRDRSSRVVELSIVTIQKEEARVGGPILLKDRYVYRYVGADKLPAWAMLYKTYAGRNETPFARVVFKFWDNGAKIAETVSELGNGPSKDIAYSYDNRGRLISVVTTVRNEIVETRHFDRFANGRSAMVLLTELTLQSGQGLQKGIPEISTIETRFSHLQVNAKYTLNEFKQPILIDETDNEGKVSQTKIVY